MEHIENLEGWLNDYNITGEKHGNEFLTVCPFHSDTNPSLSLNLEKQLFHCKVCGAQGDAIKFLAGKLGYSRAAIYKQVIGHESKDTINQKLIVEWNRSLKHSGEWLKKLKDKGINLATIEKYLLGFDGERITIPIYHSSGKILNVRRYLPNAKKAKMLSLKDHGAANLYPREILSKDTIHIVEGEIKALLLNQMGFPAISPTGGVDTWSNDWSEFFKGKKVYIIFDIDKAGKRGAMKLARKLFPYTNNLHIVELPIDKTEIPKGDITDYVVALQHSKEDLENLFDNTPKWEPPKVEDKENKEITKLHLSQTSKGKYAGKLVETKTIISAKDTAPYLVPKKFQVRCTKDQEICVFCAVCAMPDDSEIEIEPTNPALLEMINIPKNRMNTALKSAAKIPPSCKVCSFKITEKQNIEEVRLMPELELETLENQQVVRKAFYVGHGIETNACYRLQSKVVPEPSTQYATLLIYNAEPSVDSLSTFKLSRAMQDQLQIFKPERWTLESLKTKLHRIYEDLESNVTRIYKRRDLHAFYDLIFHSVLYIPFQDKIVKGWAEGLVIGDSGQGKSETIKNLLEHYQLGDKLDAKGATAAGLLGGLQETNKRWFVTWGKIPLNDKRLVVLEEVKGMDQEVIAKLTDMRSSGIAEISKIQQAKTNARTRLIWITNPRSDVPIMQYNFGVQAIPQLMGSLEDIRRLDLAIVVASGEVNEQWLNISSADRPRIPHTHTKEACKNLILWAWSRKPGDVHIPEETERLILEAATVQGRKYSSLIPLVEAADHRLKLARLACAVAARTFSCDHRHRVVVRPCHVEFVVEFLDSLYSTRANGYAEFSAIQIEQRNQSYSKTSVEKQLSTIAHAKDLIQFMLESKGFLQTDIEDWTGCDKDTAREFISTLVRAYAIRKARRSYVKTQPFIDHLKEILPNVENLLPEHLEREF